MHRNIIAIIPARKSSKRLKNKNTKILGKKQLFQWSLDLAQKVKIFSKIIITTDSKEILKSASKEKCVINLRPKKLSGDNINLVDVTLYICDLLKKQGTNVDDVVLFQPTSPFRSKKIVLKGIKNFYDCQRKNSVIAVSRIKKHPRVCLIKKNNNFSPFLKKHAFNLQSQALEEIFSPNGSFYLSTLENLKKNKSFFSKKTIFIENFYDYEDIDIDEQKDLDLAKIIFNKYGKRIKNWQS
ncbi:acylneuraminate cytidylyltransferase family protein [Candidatus Pelagibacter sp.]|nr:acylneuraminate cytidylyltransferase family protein [Candidatus Pelagibacter sp.]